MRRALIQAVERLGSLESVANATLRDLLRVKGIGRHRLFQVCVFLGLKGYALSPELSKYVENYRRRECKAMCVKCKNGRAVIRQLARRRRESERRNKARIKTIMAELARCNHGADN